MDEKEHEERWDERWSYRHHWRDPLSGVVFGLMLVVLGACFYLRQIGAIPKEIWWAYMLAGFGGLWILGGLIRLFVPRWSYRALGMLVPGIVAGAIGMMFILGSFQFWPLILVAVGVAVIVAVVIRAIWRGTHTDE